MNPTDVRWNITPLLVGAIGLIGAVVLGVYIGGSEIAKLVLIFGAVAILAVIAGMRQHIWLLVPMCWGLTGSVYVLPLPFTVRDLIVMLVVAMTFALLALRKFRFQNRWGLLDFILFLNLAQIVIVFTFHPVGLRSLSSETVGARPYFNIAIATLAYLILSNQVISAKLSRSLPVLMFIPEAFTSLVSLAVRMKPSLGYILGPFYTGFLSPGLNNPNAPMQRVAIGSGNTLVTLLCSYFRPLTLLSPFRPVRLLLFVSAIILVLLSGFRSQLISAVAIFLIASYFRGGLGDLMTVLMGMVAAALALILINSIHPLPLPMQRTVSFLPGNWNSLAAADARGSTEWRLEMWREVPKSTKYIRDRVMGDGFGFNKAELQAMYRELYSTGQVSQEDFMIIGAFHNGPLSTIRFVGAVGLLLYYLLLIYLAMVAWRLIRAAERTDFYRLALFVGLALIWEPFNYTFIFGSYDASLPNSIFGVGMLKMIGNSLRYKPSETKSTAIPAPSPIDRGAAVLS